MTIQARSFHRNFPHSDIEMVPESGVVTITGDVNISGTMTAGATVDGGGAVALADDFSAAGTLNNPLIATDKSADKIGFFGATPVVQPLTYTQTYATADKTHSNPTAAALTVTDGAGTPNGTIAAIATGGASADQASVIEAVQEIADQIAKLVADMADVKQVVNSIIDDLQALGLVDVP